MARGNPYALLASACYFRPAAPTLELAVQVQGQLIAQGSFLPPLVVLDVLSALQGVSRGLTPPGFLARRSSAGWGEFLNTLVRRSLLARGADSRHAARVLQALADNVAHAIGDFWTQAGLAEALAQGPARLAEAEARGLSGGAPSWSGMWDYLDRHVATEEGRDALLPFSASFRSGGDGRLLPPLPGFDPQLDQLVHPVASYRSDRELTATPLPRGPDSGPRRHYAGDFLERAPGPLPQNLSEISPSDLVLVAPLSAGRAALARTMRLRFALKAGEGDIHQRYHSQLVAGVRGRRLSIRIRLVDALESRDVARRVMGYLPVSLYRATAIFFLHHLAQLLARPGCPECEVSIELGNGSGRAMVRRLPADFHVAAAVSPRRCAEVIWSCLPTFFSVAHPAHLSVTQERSAPEDPGARSVELLLGARGGAGTAVMGDSHVIEVAASATASALIPRLLATPDSRSHAALAACEPAQVHHLGRQLADLLQADTDR